MKTDKEETRRQLGQILLSIGAINRNQLDDALAEQRITGQPLGQILLSNDSISATVLMAALRAQLEATRLDLWETPPDPAVIGMIEPWIARQYGLVPVRLLKSGRPVLIVAGRAPVSFRIIQTLEEICHYPVRIMSAREDQIYEALQRYYPHEDFHSPASAVG